MKSLQKELFDSLCRRSPLNVPQCEYLHNNVAGLCFSVYRLLLLWRNVTAWDVPSVPGGRALRSTPHRITARCGSPGSTSGGENSRLLSLSSVSASPVKPLVAVGYEEDPDWGHVRGPFWPCFLSSFDPWIEGRSKSHSGIKSKSSDTSCVGG